MMGKKRMYRNRCESEEGGGGVETNYIVSEYGPLTRSAGIGFSGLAAFVAIASLVRARIRLDAMCKVPIKTS